MGEQLIVIWHAKTDDAFRDTMMYRKGGMWDQDVIRSHLSEGHYREVGVLRAPGGEADLEAAYAGSQNMERSWKPGQRSTSKGDVLVVVGDGEPKAFVVASFGFDPLEDFDAGRLVGGLAERARA